MLVHLKQDLQLIFDGERFDVAKKLVFCAMHEVGQLAKVEPVR